MCLKLFSADAPHGGLSARPTGAIFHTTRQLSQIPIAATAVWRKWVSQQSCTTALALFPPKPTKEIAISHWDPQRWLLPSPTQLAHFASSPAPQGLPVHVFVNPATSLWAFLRLPEGPLRLMEPSSGELPKERACQKRSEMIFLTASSALNELYLIILCCGCFMVYSRMIQLCSIYI